MVAVGVEAGGGFVEFFKELEGVAVGEAELGEAEAGMEGLDGEQGGVEGGHAAGEEIDVAGVGLGVGGELLANLFGG